MSTTEMGNAKVSPVDEDAIASNTLSIPTITDHGPSEINQFCSFSLDPLDVMLIYICIGAVLVVLTVHISRYLLGKTLYNPRECIVDVSSGQHSPSIVTNELKGINDYRFRSRTTSIGESCNWTNTCLSWLYLHQDCVPMLVHEWIQGLNEYAHYNSVNDVIIKFENAQAGSLPPVFSNVKVTTCDNDALTINVDIECLDVVLLVSASHTKLSSFKSSSSQYYGNNNINNHNNNRDIGDQTTTFSNWDITIDKLQGQLEITATSGIDNEIQMVGNLIQNGINSSILQTRLRARSQNPCCQQNLVKEMVERCLLNSTTRYQLMNKPCNYSPVGTNSAKLQTSNLAYSSPYQHNQPHQKANISPKKPERKCDFNNSLIVKVIKANGLADKEFAQADSFCILSIDHPKQQHRTSIVNNTINPFWDEHFLFELSIDSAHLEFLVYDMNSQHNVRSYEAIGMDCETLEGEATLLGRANLQVSAVSSKKSSCRQIIPLTSVNKHSHSNTAGSITVELIYREEAISHLPTDITMNVPRNDDKSNRIQQYVQKPNFSSDIHDDIHQFSIDGLSGSSQKLNAHEASITSASMNINLPKVTLAKPSKFSDDDVFIGDSGGTMIQKSCDYVRTSKIPSQEETPKISIESADKNSIISNSENMDTNNEILSVNSMDVKERRKSRSFSEAVKRKFRSRSTERKREKTNSLRSTSSQGNTVYLTPPTHSSTPSPTPKKRSRSLSSSLRKIFTPSKPKIERRGSGHIVIPVRETSLPKDATRFSSSLSDKRTFDEDIQRQRRHLQMSATTNSSEVIMSTSAPQHKQLLY